MAGKLARLRGLLVATFFCTTSACVALPDPTQPVDIASRVKLVKDPYDGYWKAQGPGIVVWGYADVTSYKLRAWSRNQNFGRPAYAQLHVKTHPDEWFYLKYAHSAGVEYEVEPIERKEKNCSESGCDYVETVGINMSIDQLHAIARSPGFDVRVTGRKGTVFFFVPAAYFRGFLTAIGQRPT